MTRNKGELYKSKLIESSSPISTRPGTPFRLGVLGILEEDLCMELRGTASEPLESRPYSSPIVVDYRMPACELEVATNEVIEGEVGDKFLVELDHGSNINFLNRLAYNDSDIVKAKFKGGNIELELLEEFAGLIDFEIIYDNCLSCILTLSVTILEPEVEEPEEPEEPMEPEPEPEEPEIIELEVPEPVVRCPGIHTNAETRIKVGSRKTYLPTAEQLAITADLQVIVSDRSVVSVEYEGAPSFKATIRGLKVGVAYLKFSTVMRDGTTCQRVSKFVVYDTNEEPIEEPAPEGFRSSDNGVIVPADRSGREPLVFAGSTSDGLITPSLLSKMIVGDKVMLLCNYGQIPGCKFDLEIGGEPLVTNVDIEGGGRHKAVILNLPDRPSIENGGTVKLIARVNKKPEWGIHIMTYEHVKQYLDNNTALTESAGDIYNHKIAFVSNPSDNPIIAETMTSEFIIDI